MAEYLSKAVALAQDAAKLSMRFSEGLVDNALEFGLDTPGSFYDNAEFKLAQVRKELASDRDKDKVVAMKRLLAAVAKGHDASEYFADVVKNVASGSLDVRRLVYMYLLRYAEQEQDLALLSVNTFQRDLADDNQVIRGMALRVMSSIRVPSISPIVVLAVRRLAADRSAHVRKTAALAVVKLVRLDAGQRAELEGVVESMLRENSPLAVGSVVRAFCAVCPARYDMVHAHFRRWCALLPDLDEWGQAELARLLTAYARTQFARPSAAATALDPDHALLLRAVQPLMQSRNSAVVMAAVAAFSHVAPPALLPAVARPLVRLLKAGREAAYVALTNISQIAARAPAMFAPYTRSFFVAASDAPFTRRIKLRILAAVASPRTAALMAAELAAYAQSPLPDVAVGAAAVLLACARRVREAAMDCFARLLLMVDDTRADVACASMRAVRALLLDGTVRDLPSRPATLYDIVCFLVRKLDTAGLRADEARAHVVSLVSVFADSKFGTLHALDVLRRGAQTFKSEGPQTRMQLLELAVRLLLACRAGEAEEGAAASPLAERLRANSDKLADMHAYLFTLARYDVSFDVRDRARMLRALCPLPGDEAHVELMPHVLAIARDLLAPAAGDDIIPKASAASSCCARAVEYTVGSLSLTVGRPMSEYAPLLDWPSAPPTRVDRSDVTVDAEHVAPRAITIAGISGRAQPFSTASADYSTPRSATDHDDLDAFLNSPSDSAAARFPLPRSAVVFHQPAESSDSESDSGDETSSSGLSSSSSNASSNASGNASGSECNDQAGSSSDDASGDESTNPAAGAAAVDGFMAYGRRHSSDDEHAQPLMDGTSQHWQ